MESWSFLTGYPQLREAKTGASGRLPGTPVQRLAAIVHGERDTRPRMLRAIGRAHPRCHDQHRRRHGNN
jgi:hypothetical protein